MQLKPEELKRRLKQGTRDPLYYFSGPETYLIEEMVNLIRSSCLPTEEEQVNFHTCHGDDLDLDDLISLTRTLPLVGKKRVIVLKGLDKIKKEGGEAKRLGMLLQRKFPSVHMILVAEKLDMRTKLGTTIKQSAVAVHFYKMFENQIPSWIVQKAGESKKVLSLPLARIMTHMLGNDLYRIENELTKMYLYMGEDTQVTREHLAIISGESRIFSVFDLVENLGKKNVESSLKILDKLIEEGSSPILLLTMIVRQFRALYLAKSLVEKGRGVTEVTAATGLAPMFARQAIEQAKSFSRERLQTLHAKFLETDLSLKSSSCQPRFILENLIIEMCQEP